MWMVASFLSLLVTICGVALSGGGVALLLHFLLRPKPISGSYGTAAFATPHEISSAFIIGKKGSEPGSVLLGDLKGRSVSLSPTQSRQHGIIVAGSGMGKSFSFFLPNAARSRGTSCVYSDPKSELFRYTSGLHPSLRFAPCEPAQSEGFNWIPLCSEARIAEVAARAIVEAGNTRQTEQAWLDLEASYLAALFSHASTLLLPTPLTAYRLFATQDQKTLLAQLSQSRSSVAREQANLFRQTSDRMKGSIVPIVAARLQFLRDPVVSRFTSATLTPPDFSVLRRTPTSVYWCLPERDIPRLRPLSNLFFTLLLEQLNGDEKESVPVSPSVPILFFLDEFGTIGALPDFETTIALARGRGIGFWLGVQSLSQLETLYGKSRAQTILTNCATKIALSGLDVETAEYFSKTLGIETRERKLRSWQRKRFTLFSHSLSDALQEHGRPLLTSDEIRRLSLREMLVISGNQKPMTLEKRRYRGKPAPARVAGQGIEQAMQFEMERSEIEGTNPLPRFPEDLLLNDLKE